MRKMIWWKEFKRKNDFQRRSSFIDFNSIWFYTLIFHEQKWAEAEKEKSINENWSKRMIFNIVFLNKVIRTKM